MNMATITKERPKTGHGRGVTYEGAQVVLYNDSVNAFDYVVGCLTKVFGHGESMARKIAMEAHTKGRAIAEVEPMERAVVHASMLTVMGLKAEAQEF